MLSSVLKFTVSPAEYNLRFTCAVCLRFLSLPHVHLSGAVFLSLQPLSRSLLSPHYSLKNSSSVRKLCISRQGGLTFVFGRSDRGLCQILQSSLCPVEQRHVQRDGVSPTRGRAAEPQVHPTGQHHPSRGLRPGVLFPQPSQAPGALRVCVSNGASAPQPAPCRPCLVLKTDRMPSLL